MVVGTHTNADRLSPLLTLAQSFGIHLQAGNKSARTVQGYLEGVRLLNEHLIAMGMPREPESLTREHVESFIAAQLEQHKPSTAWTRYRSLQQFFNWLLEEGEITASPMARMKPPRVPEAPPPVLVEADIKKLLKVCDGRDFRNRRDTAILRLFLDTGMRRMELAGLAVDDVDLVQGYATVMGKGSRPRVCAFGRRTAQALDRYLRERAKHQDASMAALWLGHAGPMRGNGIYQMIVRRAETAGLAHVFTHLMRHTFAHEYLAAGGQEGDLMMLAGWRSRSMLDRYGKSAAAQRAREAHKRMGLGDRY